MFWCDIDKSDGLGICAPAVRRLVEELRVAQYERAGDMHDGTIECTCEGGDPCPYHRSMAALPPEGPPE